jgi:spore maturation protein CgeB
MLVSKINRMRLFYLINEPYLNYQLGYRNAISKLIESGDLSACYYYSFNAKFQEFDRKWELVIKDLVVQIVDYKPDAILFAHTHDKKIDDSFFKQIEAILGYKPIYALDERDVYGKFAKRIPKELLFLASKCDVVFVVASGGWMYDQFKSSIKKKLVYLPHVCDDFYFEKATPLPTNKKYDVIMIGNLAKSRVPFKSMPGVFERIKVAKHLHKKHGSRFAVFGNGWDKYPFSAGPISFFKQDEVLMESNLSIGVDHFFSYRQYFSDRLPIALFSGIPHLSFLTPDIDLLFKEQEHIFYFGNCSEASNKIDKILSGKIKNISEITEKAKKLIHEKYTERTRMLALVNYLKSCND